MKPFNYASFIQPLGNLFYAISAADKHITKEEYSLFNKLIREELNDILGHDEKEKLVEIFIECARNKFDVYNSFNKFREFKSQNESLFSTEVKQSIWNIAEKISSASSQKNKSELVILSQLASVLS